MRIAVCAKLDLFGVVALNLLLPRLAGHQVSLFFSIVTRPDEGIVPELQQMRLLERDLPLGVLFPLLDSLSGPPPGFLTVRQLGAHYGCPMEVITDLKRDGGGAALARVEPDLVLSVRFSLIFPQWLIDRPSLGIINVHPGRLPEYGGLFAPFWQLLHGEAELGCTVHYVDRGIDSGPILAIEPVRFDPLHSMLWHAWKLYTAGVLRVAEIAGTLAAGQLVVATPQIADRRGYYRFPTVAEFAALAARGVQTATPEDYLACLRLFLPSADPSLLSRILPLPGGQAARPLVGAQ